jgi:hypothetical protein
MKQLGTLPMFESEGSGRGRGYGMHGVLHTGVYVVLVL